MLTVRVPKKVACQILHKQGLVTSADVDMYVYMRVCMHGLHEVPSASPAIKTMQIANVTGQVSGQSWHRWSLETRDLLMRSTQYCHAQSLNLLPG